jgi:hypothetical protein
LLDFFKENILLSIPTLIMPPTTHRAEERADAVERRELLSRLDSLSKDACAAGYLLLITESTALESLAASPMTVLMKEQREMVEAAAAREAGTASRIGSEVCEKESATKHKAAESNVIIESAVKEVRP